MAARGTHGLETTHGDETSDEQEYLVDRFGADKPLRDISPDGRRRLCLLEKGHGENTTRKLTSIAKAAHNPARYSLVKPGKGQEWPTGNPGFYRSAPRPAPMEVAEEGLEPPTRGL